MKLLDKVVIRRIYLKNTGLPKFDRLIKLGICYLYIIRRCFPYQNSCGGVRLILKGNEVWRLVKVDVYDYDNSYDAKKRRVIKNEIGIDVWLPSEKNTFYSMRLRLHGIDQAQWKVMEASDGGSSWSGHIDYFV